MWYERGCAVRIRRIFSIREDVQYKQGTSSLRITTCSMKEAIISTNEDYSAGQAHHECEWRCAVQARQIIKFWYSKAKLAIGLNIIYHYYVIQGGGFMLFFLSKSYRGFLWSCHIALIFKLRKNRQNKVSRDKMSRAQLRMTIIELFPFYILIVVHTFKFNSFIIILIITKIELSNIN